MHQLGQDHDGVAEGSGDEGAQPARGPRGEHEGAPFEADRIGVAGGVDAHQRGPTGGAGIDGDRHP